jgi:SNF2 family DNA or RNA helicase
MKAIGRIERIGQTKPIFIHYFVLNGTIEESVQKFSRSKRHKKSGEFTENILGCEDELGKSERNGKKEEDEENEDGEESNDFLPSFRMSASEMLSVIGFKSIPQSNSKNEGKYIFTQSYLF